MNIEEFNEKYKEQGGIKQLSSMRENLDTLKKISECFGVSGERARQWMIEFFEEKYDPRYKRRKKAIEAIKVLIDKYGLKKTRVLCQGTNKSYLKAAIDSFHQQKNEK